MTTVLEEMAKLRAAVAGTGRYRCAVYSMLNAEYLQITLFAGDRQRFIYSHAVTEGRARFNFVVNI